jgi:hypothetical protein
MKQIHDGRRHFELMQPDLAKVGYQRVPRFRTFTILPLFDLCVFVSFYFLLVASFLG